MLKFTQFDYTQTTKKELGMPILNVAIVPFFPLLIPAETPVELDPVSLHRHTLVVPNSQIWLAGVWNLASTDVLKTSITIHNP